MKRRVRKTQAIRIWDGVLRQFKVVKVKHDTVQPATMLNRDRIANYAKQTGKPVGVLTPRQRRRVAHKHHAQPLAARQAP